jgi:polysaccharide export outer membrane protein
MRGARILFAVVAALAVSGCMREPAQTYYIIDPQTGQPVPVVTQQQQQFVQPQYAERAYPTPGAAAPPQSNSRGLYSRSPAYAQQAYAQPQYAQPTYQPPAAQPRRTPSSGRGLFNSQRSAPVYTQPQVVQPQAMPQVQQPYIAQYTPPPRMAAPPTARQAYAAAPANYAPDYTLDSGDKLRVVVFGQDGITNSYMVDAGGNINLPLIGAVPARGGTTQQLSQQITARLKQGFVRDPSVSVEVEAYRPFFILGEVTTPGQYPYVANMTAETAIAIAGGFAPRASKGKVQVTRNAPGQQFNGEVPLNFPLRPGDTVVVKERWF